jgi:hypothetical protein
VQLQRGRYVAATCLAHDRRYEHTQTLLRHLGDHRRGVRSRCRGTRRACVSSAGPVECGMRPFLCHRGNRRRAILASDVEYRADRRSRGRCATRTPRQAPSAPPISRRRCRGGGDGRRRVGCARRVYSFLPPIGGAGGLCRPRDTWNVVAKVNRVEVPGTANLFRIVNPTVAWDR